MHDELITGLRAGLVDFDLDAIEPWLHPQVVWGDCTSRADVLSMLSMFNEAGASASAATFEPLPDRIVSHIEAKIGGQSVTTIDAVFVDDGLVVEIRNCASLAEAAAVTRSGPFERKAEGVEFRVVHPVFPVADVAAAIAHYERLGFDVESYDGGAYYAFARRGSVELHLALVESVDPTTSNVAIYLRVDDARALYAEWRDAGATAEHGRLHAPTDTDYGQCEGAHVDPWGNLIRFGSPIA